MKPSVTAKGLVCVVALLVMLFAVGGAQRRGEERSPAHLVRASSPVHRRAPARAASASSLAAQINGAQAVIENRASSSTALAKAGLVEELATGALGREKPRARHTTLTLLRPAAAATVRADLAASTALTKITPPEKRFPPWRIIQPPSPATLMGYFRQAQSRFGVGWQYLAAINFIETRFGRIRGPSTAGAQGPMQFLPSTWATYGRGSIYNPRDAIFAAARFLVANGAPRDMAAAIYSYNNSTSYVAAVQDYAARMRSDLRAYVGYYYWQVLFSKANGLFLLPVGYPHARPKRIH